MGAQSDTSADLARRIELRLTIKDAQRPTYDFTLLAREVHKSDDEYKQAMARARHWHALLEVLIRQADDADKKAHVSIASTAVPAVEGLDTVTALVS